MVLLGITSLVGVGIPVVAARTDADDASLAVMGGILPQHDSTITTDAENPTASAAGPNVIVVISTPVGTDVVLCGRVGDVVTGIGAINLVGVITSDEILIDGMAILAVKDAECPRAAALLGIGLVLTPAVVGRRPLVITGSADE